MFGVRPVTRDLLGTSRPSVFRFWLPDGCGPLILKDHRRGEDAKRSIAYMAIHLCTYIYAKMIPLM